MTTSLILYDPTKTAATVAPEFLALKSAALEGVEAITEINSDADNAVANKLVGEVSTLIKNVNKAHQEAKAPYWAACKAIDERKNEVLAELEKEELRVNKLCGNWVQDQLEKQREAKRERSRQLDKIEAERRAEEARAEQACIDAEVARRRQVDAAEAEAAKARSKKAKTEAAEKLAELERQRQESAAQAERDRAEREVQAEQEKAAVVAVAPITKAAGQVVKAVWTFEVINILSLAKVRPDLVKMEPRTAEINELINSLGVREMAGLRIFEEVRIGQRKPGMKFLDV